MKNDAPKKIDALISAGKYEEAAELASMELSRSDSPMLQARLLYQSGQAKYLAGKKEEGLDTFAKALNILERYNTPESGEIMFHIAAFYLMTGALEVARRLYRLVLTILPESSSEYIGAMHNLGEIHLRSGNFEDALEYFEKIYEMARARNDKKGMAYASINMAELYASMGDREKTLLWLHRAYNRGLESREERITRVVSLAVSLIEGQALEEILKMADDIKKNGTIPSHDVAEVFYHYSAFREKEERKRLLEHALLLYTETGDGIMHQKIISELNALGDEDYL